MQSYPRKFFSLNKNICIFLLFFCVFRFLTAETEDISMQCITKQKKKIYQNTVMAYKQLAEEC